MPTGSLVRRVARLEATHGVASDTVAIEGAFIRADGSEYTTRYLASRGDVAYSFAQADDMVRRRAVQLAGQVVDVDAASLLDLLAARDYSAIVRRVEAWYERFGCDLPAHFAWLAGELRRELAEGRIRDGGE